QYGTRVQGTADDGADYGSSHMDWTTEAQCHRIATTAPVQCRLTPRHSGEYRFLATVIDTQGRKQTTVLHAWSTGVGAATWPEDDSVTLVPSAASYSVGQTARVLVQNPYPGARALVTVTQDG